MCGIAGISISDADREGGVVNSKRLVKDLLLGIEHRGTHATGFAFQDKTGEFQVHKKDVKASDFVTRNMCLPKRAATAIAHTRMWTQGPPTVNANNHPIVSGDIVGVHNGWVTNDDSLWGTAVEAKRRQAEVDSEVIFAMLAYGYQDSGATWKDTLETVRGNAALAWLDKEREDVLFLARANSSPLVIASTPGGSVVFASESGAIEKALKAQGIEAAEMFHVAEGKLLTVCKGEVLNIEDFEPAAAWTSSYSSYKGGTTSGRRGTTYVYSNGATRAINAAEAWDDDEQYEFDLHEYMERTAAAGDSFKSAAESAAVFLGQDTELDDSLIGEDDDLDDILGEYEASFWSPSYMSKEYFDPKKDAPFAQADAYFTAYEEREGQIDAWMRSFKGPENTMGQNAYRMGAFIRPGDFVTTRVGNDEAVVGQVMELPNEFPQGKYTIRCFLGRNGKSVAVSLDTVIVQRHFAEFTPTKKAGTKEQVELHDKVGNDDGLVTSPGGILVPTGDLSGYAPYGWCG